MALIGHTGWPELCRLPWHLLTSLNWRKVTQIRYEGLHLASVSGSFLVFSQYSHVDRHVTAYDKQEILCCAHVRMCPCFPVFFLLLTNHNTVFVYHTVRNSNCPHNLTYGLVFCVPFDCHKFTWPFNWIIIYWCNLLNFSPFFLLDVTVYCEVVHFDCLKQQFMRLWWKIF